ncbi:RluA family pseudouridine synthase [Elioraea sp.]|jgi:23S rRNA pseudouridine955/2504/2580 synthase|uniref:RluA family pseudouridine synthase n=1 Tax=Elioraea sp. TaxID=2185103 RepID=UPI0021DD9063|nr:RluA family pseudouridine synthase [Elioraea sp.]GIX10299.1 MAG: pseudouridine synthase [Elioraea sp.]
MSAVETRTVAEDEAEIRLDRWFRRHFPGLPHGVLAKLLRTGQIRVDGRRAETGTRLAPGQAVRIPPLGALDGPRQKRALAVDPREAKELERLVLYRDASVIVLDKPFGLPVQGGPGIVKSLDALLDALRFGADERPRLVHRLDRDTTGVLVVARSAAAASRLAAAFRSRDAEKTYWAVTVGVPSPREGRIDAPLAKRAGQRGERVTLAGRDEDDAARAITDYRTLDAAGRRAAWLELSPLTGRTHQLRVHCVGLGCTILGDAKYGGAAAMLEGFPDRLHLHARGIAIPHPEGGVLRAEAPLPAHMRATFAALGFAAPRPIKPARGPGRRD